MAQDHYHILGIDEDADLSTIRSAYRQLAKVHHPDLNPGDPYADALFQRINTAYSVLSNPKSRRDYDLVRQHVQETQPDIDQTTTRSTTSTGWSKWRHTNTPQHDVNPGNFTNEFLGTDIFATMMARNIKEQLRGPRFDLRALPIVHYVILGILAAFYVLVRPLEPSILFSLIKWFIFAVYTVISTTWIHGLRSLERFRPNLLGRFDVFIVHAISLIVTALLTWPFVIVVWGTAMS